MFFLALKKIGIAEMLCVSSGLTFISEIEEP